MENLRTFSDLRKWILANMKVPPLAKVILEDTGYEGSELSGLFETWMKMEYDIANGGIECPEDYINEIEEDLVKLEKVLDGVVKDFQKTVGTVKIWTDL